MQHDKYFEGSAIGGAGEVDMNDSKAMINYQSPMQNEKLKELQSTSENFAKQIPESSKLGATVVSSGVFKGSMIKTVPPSNSLYADKIQRERKVEVQTMLPSIPVKLQPQNMTPFNN